MESTSETMTMCLLLSWCLTIEVASSEWNPLGSGPESGKRICRDARRRPCVRMSFMSALSRDIKTISGIQRNKTPHLLKLLHIDRSSRPSHLPSRHVGHCAAVADLEVLRSHIRHGRWHLGSSSADQTRREGEVPAGREQLGRIMSKRREDG